MKILFVFTNQMSFIQKFKFQVLIVGWGKIADGDVWLVQKSNLTDVKVVDEIPNV